MDPLIATALSLELVVIFVLLRLLVRSRGGAPLTPGQRARITGRYACSRCGNTIILNRGNICPPCSHCNRPGVLWALDESLT